MNHTTDWGRRWRNTGYITFFLSGICAISSGIIVSILQGKYEFDYGMTGTMLGLMSIGNMAASFALVHHRSGVRDPGGDIDVRHGLGQRGVLETAVADLGFQFEGRKRRAAHFAPGPEFHRQFAARREVLELTGVEGRDQRQHVLELHLVAAGLEVHGHGVAVQFDPAVETDRNGVQTQRIAREGEAVVRKVGVDHGDKLRLGVAQQRNAARHETHGGGRQPQVEVGAVGRHVAPETQREGRGREPHVRRIVLVADRRVGNAEVADRKPERRRSSWM